MDEHVRENTVYVAHASVPTMDANCRRETRRDKFHAVELDLQKGPTSSPEGLLCRVTATDVATKFTVMMHTRSRSTTKLICVRDKQKGFA